MKHFNSEKTTLYARKIRQ